MARPRAPGMRRSSTRWSCRPRNDASLPRGFLLYTRVVLFQPDNLRAELALPMPLTARVASSRAPFTCSTPRGILMRCELSIRARRSCLAKARASINARLATLAARPSTAPPLRRRAAPRTSSESLSPPACTQLVPPPACEQVRPLASSVLAPRHSQRFAPLLLLTPASLASSLLSRACLLQHPLSMSVSPTHSCAPGISCRAGSRGAVRRCRCSCPLPTSPRYSTHNTHVSCGRVPVSRSPSIHLAPACCGAASALSRCAFCTTAILYRPVTPWLCAHSCMQMG